MALTVRTVEVANDGRVIHASLLPYLSETKPENVEIAKREAERYLPNCGENPEQGYFLFRDAEGREFRLIR